MVHTDEPDSTTAHQRPLAFRRRHGFGATGPNCQPPITFGQASVYGLKSPASALEIQPESRTAVEGQLYSTHHVRTAAGVSIGLRVTGVPAGWNLPVGQMTPLGGESRFAECIEWSGTLPPPSGHPNKSAPREIMLVALTPLDLEDAACRGRVPLDLPRPPSGRMRLPRPPR